jgi:hypothetical protein
MLMPAARSDQEAIFQAAFREAWGRIPEIARAEMTAYWADGGRRIVGVYLDPHLGAMACGAEDALGLSFNLDCIPEFPGEDGLPLAIAHELGHVWLRATGDAAHLAPQPNGEEAVKAWDDRREQRVWETLSGWGFDMARHDALTAYARCYAEARRHEQEAARSLVHG